MKRFVILFFLLLTAVSAQAVEVAGVSLEPVVEVCGEQLQLNGYGIRKKLFFKIYIGSLYTAQRAASADEVLADGGAKLIRMNFLYAKVGREKITEAFAEGFAKNSPQLVGTPEVRQFLALFTDDFVEGDTVDLELGADGGVVVRQNRRILGTLRSPSLSRAILLIYLGEQPADEDLKAGMLGRN